MSDRNNTKKAEYKTEMPPSFPGSVYIFNIIFTAVGVGLALGAESFGVEAQARAFFKLDGSLRSTGIVLAVAAILSNWMLAPAIGGLFAARAKYRVGHPVHHIAPGENGISESDRIYFLCKLRAYEQIIEWLPIFIAHTVAGVLLDHQGLVVVVSGLYFVGKILYSLGYGTGRPSGRIAGLFISETVGLATLRGALLLDLYRHYA